MGASTDYGRRLIPQIIDARAAAEPDRVSFRLPRSDNDLSQGFYDVTASQLANAVNRVAWWLHSELGQGVGSPTIAYIGPHDIRYIVLTIAAVKAGYKLFIISPRISIEGSVAVLEKADCKTWIKPSQAPEHLPQLLAQWPMKVLEIAEASEVIKADAVPPFAYDKTWEEAKSEPFCMLHTSGSTGLSKPIIWRNSMIGTLDATRLLPKHLDRGPWTDLFEENDNFYSAFPLFHSAALVMNILIPSYFGTTNVLGPAGVIPQVSLINELLEHGNIKCWHIIPSIVDDIGQSLEVAAKFKGSKYIIASGGPINYNFSNKVAPFVRIANVTGTSEGLFQGSLLPEAEDWNYFAFHPWAGFDFRKIDDGTYEHFGVRNEKNVELFQGYFHTFPDLSEISYKDLYAPHPSKPELWVFRGRTDDMLVLSNGEKINPVSIEVEVAQHPLVNACLVVGSAKFQAALLVEPAKPDPSTDAERQAFVNAIWPAVERANTVVPQHGRVLKECILFTSPNKPFARTDKNTVKRRLTVMEYEAEIEAFYKGIDSGKGLSLDTNLDISTVESTVKGLSGILSSLFPKAQGLAPDTDIFQAGVDSLLVLQLVRHLRSATEKLSLSNDKKQLIAPQLIYSNPTLEKLALAIFGLQNTRRGSADNPVQEQMILQAKLAAQYSANWPAAAPIAAAAPDSGNTILITGSSGSLGSYLLDRFLQLKTVVRVICLNRSADAQQTQAKTAEKRGIKSSAADKEVIFFQADLAQPRLGLSQQDYQFVLDKTTHVIHNAWPVNFNLSLSSFEPHIKGTRNLIDFCLESTLSPSFMFVSTIATVAHLEQDPIVEAPLESLTTILGGYGASKQVAERMILKAWRKTPIKATVVRLGQLAGPVQKEAGQWNPSEWLPAVVSGSKSLGKVPTTLGSLDRVDWVPVDLAAATVVDMSVAADVYVPTLGNKAGTTLPNGTPVTQPVYHVVNPEPAEWVDLLPIVDETFGDELTHVSWADWVDALAALQHQDNTDAEAVPALKLLGTFERVKREAEAGKSWPSIGSVQAMTASGTLAALEGVSDEWMELWLRQWGYGEGKTNGY